MDSMFFDAEFLKKIGVGNLPPEEQESILSNMHAAVFQAILLRAIDQLNDQQQESLNGLIKENESDQEEAFKFLSENVPYMQLLANEEIEKFKTETLQFLVEVEAPAA